MVCIDDEIPFEIPATWEWCRIKQLFSMQAGKNIKAFELSDIPTASHTYPCYGGNGLRGYVNHYNTEGNFILVGRQGALCGNVKEVKGKFYATEHAVVTNGYGLTNLQWAYYFLWALDLNQYATATAQPGLAVSNIIEVLIPLPPFEEQIRIASKIDNTLQYVDSFTKAQKDLEVLNNEVILNLLKSILQEAIQGKLVPQDPNDEPASVLLQRIREEKLRLVKEGKLKKKDVVDSDIFKGDDNKYYEQIGKDVTDITDEIPFDIPDSWEWCRLRDVCSIFTGATFRKDETNSDCHGIRILRGGNILPFEIVRKADDIFLAQEQVKESILLKQNDIITPAVTSLENIGKMARVEQDMPDVTVGVFVFVLRPHYSDKWLAKFLLYFMSSPSAIEFMKSITNKSGQAFYNIGKERLATTLIPILPKEEEQRIVIKIEELFDWIKGS